MSSARLESFICITCGTQFAPTDGPPPACPICLDERQYVGANGQEWTTRNAMQRGEWKNVLREQEPDLIGIGTEPKFGIGQRALLVRTPQGNVLWDCLSFLDDRTLRAVQQFGGISAIAISHPHYYTSMIEWSRAFGDAPIYLHESDRPWVMQPDERIRFWSGQTKNLLDGLTLVHTGGHFAGFQVLHWPQGAGGLGVLLSGDQPQVLPDVRWVSFMYSYPNYIPLNASTVRHVADTLEPLAFDRIYGAFWPGVVRRDAKEVLARSVERYLQHIAG